MSENDVSAFSILCGRYQDVLKGTDLKSLAIFLAKGGIVSDSGLQRILTSENQREVFAKVLAEKGSASLVECRTAIDKFKLGVQAVEYTHAAFSATKRKEHDQMCGNGEESTTEERGSAPQKSGYEVLSLYCTGNMLNATIFFFFLSAKIVSVMANHTQTIL